MLTVDAGQHLLQNLFTCSDNTTINVTNEPPKNPDAVAAYNPGSKTLFMGDALDPECDWSDWEVLDRMSHELFHAYQDFSGITAQPEVEIDAYLFESLFDRQYHMPAAYYNKIISDGTVNSDGYNFTAAWNDFFKNGYLGDDYNNIYKYFLTGSRVGNQYQNKANGALIPANGGYLIYGFLFP